MLSDAFATALRTGARAIGSGLQRSASGSHSLSAFVNCGMSKKARSAEALVAAGETLPKIVNGFTINPAAQSYAPAELIRSNTDDPRRAKT